MTKNLSPDLVASLIEYDAETGKMFWKHRSRDMFSTERAFATWNSRYQGTPALNAMNGSGYARGSIMGRLVVAHRAAWAITYKCWPEGQIDHINGERADNRIANLRCVSHAENGKNQKLCSKSTTGQIGVHWYKKYHKWQAHITVNGRTKFLGYFSKIEEAVSARNAASVNYGFHENHGRKK